MLPYIVAQQNLVSAKIDQISFDLKIFNLDDAAGRSNDYREIPPLLLTSIYDYMECTFGVQEAQVRRLYLCETETQNDL